MRFCLLAVAILLAAGTPAAADQAASLDRMVEINRQALDELRLGKTIAARDHLIDAVAFGRRAGLGQHQIMARTYLHLGAVYLIGFDDKEKAQRQFAMAVKVRPSIQITPQVLTPTVQEMLETARAQVASAAKPGAMAQKTPEAPVAPAENESAKATAAANIAKIEASPAREESRTSRLAPVSPSEPGPATGGDSEATLTTAPGEKPHARSWWLSLALGSGVAWHPGRDLDAQNDYVVPSGISPAAALHVAPELGFRLNERWAFSLQSRHQLIPATGAPAMTAAERPRVTHALFARAHYRVVDLARDLELWGTATAGAGSGFRLYVPSKPAIGLDGSDTVKAGPVAVGPGVSLVYRASRHLGVVGELRTLALLGTFAAMADLTVGGAYAF